MAIFKCKMCGGDLNISADSKIVECEYCGTTQTVPSADNEKKMTLFNRANRLRLNSEFDKAAVLYEQIIAEFPEEAEAYWGLCLCNYGIEYVDDPATGKKIPTCHRASFQKLSEDENYQLAMEYADAIAQRVYRTEAREIDRINEEILSVSKNEKPYDVFICYKETDDFGGRTPDSVMAQEVYDVLTEKGYKVFFSRITLEDKLGMQYEPYIFAALNSAKVMLAFGTKYEYFHAVWVKNEWSRFLKLAAKDKTKKLIPVYKDMDPYDLPDEFKALQAQDMGKLGAVQDLVRGVGKLLPDMIPSNDVMQTVTTTTSTTSSLLKRVFMFLEDGKWQEADSYCEKVLDIDPECAEAYLGKLMAELHAHKREKIKDTAEPFDKNENFQKAGRFDARIAKELADANEYIRDRNEAARKKAESAIRLKNAQANKVVDAIRRSKENKVSSVEKQRREIIARINDLEHLLSDFDGLQSQVSSLQEEIQSIELQIEQCTVQRSKLGFFNGKEKRRIESEEHTLSEKKKDILDQLEKAKKRFSGYSSRYEIKRDIDELRKQLSELEARIESERAKDREAYSFEEALALYASDSELAELVDKVDYGIGLNAKISLALLGRKNTIQFGRYVQRMNSAPEPIEWQVLQKKDNRVLVISRYVLDWQNYNETDGRITWKTCSLRKWLNNTFISTAFSKEELCIIHPTKLSSDWVGISDSIDTTDKVFLLNSMENIKALFRLEHDAGCVPTDYATSKGAAKDSNNRCCWWLRSTGVYNSYNNGHSSVQIVGNPKSKYHGVNDCSGVRPAMWIAID